MIENDKHPLFDEPCAVIFCDERPAFWVNSPEDALMRVQAFEHARVAKAEPGSGLRFARVTWQRTTRKLFYGSEHIGWLLRRSMIKAVGWAQQQLVPAIETVLETTAEEVAK
jgi:hypothetical protein